MEQGGSGSILMKHRRAVFLLLTRHDLATQLVDQSLQPVTNSQDGDPAFEYPVGDQWGAGGVKRWPGHRRESHPGD